MAAALPLLLRLLLLLAAGLPVVRAGPRRAPPPPRAPPRAPPGGGAAGGQVGDANVLLKFKASMWSDPLSTMSGWSIDKKLNHACFWNGVKCSNMKTFRVTSLHLSGLGLAGPIIEDLGQLSELTYLNLSTNSIGGGIPSGLANCTKLTTIDLSYNLLVGSLPLALANINLTKIYLGHNQLLGTLIFLTKMNASIQELSLEYNKLNGYPLNLLATHTNLTYLDLGNNQFGGVVNPADLTPFGPLLKLLDLGANKFTGPLPLSFSYLTNLEYCDMSANFFTGALPQQLQSCTKMRYLNMSYNAIAGPMPAVWNKMPLQILDLRRNKITGALNPQLMACKTLMQLRVSDNNLGGPIPQGFGSWINLTFLDLARNGFTRSLPIDLVNAKNLQTLNASFNSLGSPILPLPPSLVTFDITKNRYTGPIPDHLTALPALENLTMAFNSFSGPIPKNIGMNQKMVALNLGSNRLTGSIPDGLGSNNLTTLDLTRNMLSGELPTSEFLDRFNTTSYRPGNPLLCGPRSGQKCPFIFPFWGKLAAGFSGGGLLVLAGLLWYLTPPFGEYTSKKLSRMTHDFNISEIIGVGGSSTVYRGHRPRGRSVAIKRLRPEYFNNFDEKNFDIEREKVYKLRHPNVLKVYGSCNSPNVKAFVLQYMPNGTVDMQLHQNAGTNLPWNKRLDIAAGVAQGLAYLHGEWQGPEYFMHCDMKGSSVLLDSNYKAHIGDVRLTKAPSPFVPSTIPGAAFCGMTGYTPPEYALSTIATTPGEVYCYGTLLLELITGVKPLEGRGIQDWVRQSYPDSLQRIIDPRMLEDGASMNQIALCTKIALHCTNDLPSERPTMRDVLHMFEEAYIVGKFKYT